MEVMDKTGVTLTQFKLIQLIEMDLILIKWVKASLEWDNEVQEGEEEAEAEVAGAVAGVVWEVDAVHSNLKLTRRS